MAKIRQAADRNKLAWAALRTSNGIYRAIAARMGRPGAVVLALAATMATVSLSAAGATSCAMIPMIPLVETPNLVERVQRGELPPVEERVPRCPAIVRFDAPNQLGIPGGTLNTFIRKSKDVKLLVVHGYARLVGYTPNYALTPDILQDIEVQAGRVFTLHLRPGHKWSDGHPFTTEDFRYWWEDVANDPELSRHGVPKAILVDGEAPKVEILSQTTVRFSWANPNPAFVPRLAGASPLFIYRPAHYLKQFHAKYVPAEALAQKVKAARVANWAVLHDRRDNMYRADNPKLPSLQPWVNQTRPPTSRFVAERNPYYHRVDSRGQQLPYLDRVVMNVVSAGLIPAKAGFGEADLISRGLSLKDYAYLRKHTEGSRHETLLWRRATGSQISLYPNQNIKDPGWRSLMRNANFRRALSLAIDREQLNNVLFFGLGREGNDTVLEESPLFKPKYRTQWAQFDLKRANALLDRLGLAKRRSDDQVRWLPDGRPLVLIVETSGEQPEQVDALELIQTTWAKAGIKMLIRTTMRETLRSRVASGDTMIAVWGGLSNAAVSADSNPEELAPFSKINFHWPQWGLFVESDGKSGEPIDDPTVESLLALAKGWSASTDKAERNAIWHEMLDIHAEQVFVIGTVAGLSQPVVRLRTLMNVPHEGIYHWDPGAYFGMYRPDTFWKRPKDPGQN